VLTVNNKTLVEFSLAGWWKRFGKFTAQQNNEQAKIFTLIYIFIETKAALKGAA